MTPQIGEGSAGEGANEIRVSTVLGDRNGPVGTAWTTVVEECGEKSVGERVWPT